MTRVEAIHGLAREGAIDSTDYVDLVYAELLTSVAGNSRVHPVPTARAHERLRWAGAVALLGAAIGVLPDAFHAVGPLAGAAILAGLDGGLIFFALGLAVAIPIVLRIHRQFPAGAPVAAAVAVFAGAFALSAFLTAPAHQSTHGRTNTHIVRLHTK